MDLAYQSVARRVMMKAFLSSDHISPATGKTIPVQISKNGAGFANPAAGAVNLTEVANGWYFVDLAIADLNTLGDLIIRGTEGTIDPTERILNVVAQVASAAAVATLQTGVDDNPTNAELATALLAADDAVLAAIAALNNLSQAQAQTAAAAALTAFGPATVGAAMTLTPAYDFAKGNVAMTEAYAANGAAPTAIQALYAIHQMLMHFAITGTSLAVKKLDGTNAFIVTLNDAADPTAASRT